MERNLRLDYFKIFLSLLVITIHIQPLFGSENLSGWLISNGIARIAVPCFFIINGFYLSAKLDNSKAFKDYIKHLIIIYISWSLIYSPLYFSLHLKKYLLLNLFMGFYHLWYIPALIIGTLFLFALKRYVKNNTHILIIALVLFFIGYYINRFIAPNLLLIYRNGITMAFPFIAIGYCIKTKRIVEKITDKTILILIILGFVGIIIESYCQFEFSFVKNLFQDFFLSLLLICPALFIYMIKHPILSSGKNFINILSSGIYFCHIMVIYYFIDNLNLMELPFLYKYILIVSTSIILSYIFYLINKRIRIFF